MGMFLTILGVILGAAGTLVERIQRKRDAEAAAEKVWKKHHADDEVEDVTEEES